jgi:hypothetical protein
MAPKARPAVIRFLSRVRRWGAAPGDCWEWDGPLNATGYGIFWFYGGGGSRCVLAHRAASEFAGGPLSPGVVVRHSCDNTRCVNPRHLLRGSQLENVADMVARNRTARGSRHSQAKLTEEMVRVAIELRRQGLRYKDIGARIGVHRVEASRIVRGLAWTHVERVV